MQHTLTLSLSQNTQTYRRLNLINHLKVEVYMCVYDISLTYLISEILAYHVFTFHPTFKIHVSDKISINSFLPVWLLHISLCFLYLIQVCLFRLLFPFPSNRKYRTYAILSTESNQHDAIFKKPVLRHVRRFFEKYLWNVHLVNARKHLWTPIIHREV